MQNKTKRKKSGSVKPDIPFISHVLLIASVLLVMTLPQTGSAAPRQSLAANELFIPFGTLHIEYEHTLPMPSTTLAISVWHEFKDVKARWISIKSLFYPGGLPLKGLGIGFSFGVIRGYGRSHENSHSSRDTLPTFGTVLNYNWLFGHKQRFLMGIGFNGRSSIGKIEDASPLKRFDGEGRLVFGIAF
ncbi:hypothetical protein JW992_03135 [candidate division KSB1 bacterium]|nr:hypothetical protein [candidate division KSB1 bacterium]